MSPEAQRIAIAEACGRDAHWFCNWCQERVKPTHVTFEETHDVSECGSPVQWIDIPDYLTNLNAMHEAEETLVHQQNWAYAHELSKLIVFGEDFPSDGLHDNEAWKVLHATATQRAEAFLRTINKWDDTK
jgi:hypothetical protein